MDTGKSLLSEHWCRFSLHFRLGSKWICVQESSTTSKKREWYVCYNAFNTLRPVTNCLQLWVLAVQCRCCHIYAFPAHFILFVSKFCSKKLSGFQCSLLTLQDARQPLTWLAAGSLTAANRKSCMISVNVCENYVTINQYFLFTLMPKDFAFVCLQFLFHNPYKLCPSHTSTPNPGSFPPTFSRTCVPVPCTVKLS